MELTFEKHGYLIGAKVMVPQLARGYLLKVRDEFKINYKVQIKFLKGRSNMTMRGGRAYETMLIIGNKEHYIKNAAESDFISSAIAKMEKELLEYKEEQKKEQQKKK